MPFQGSFSEAQVPGQCQNTTMVKSIWITSEQGRHLLYNFLVRYGMFYDTP
jgi:hypothetical protein